MGGQLEALYHGLSRWILRESEGKASEDELGACCYGCRMKMGGEGLCPRRMMWFYKNFGRGRKVDETGQDGFYLCMVYSSLS